MRFQVAKILVFAIFFDILFLQLVSHRKITLHLKHYHFGILGTPTTHPNAHVNVMHAHDWSSINLYFQVTMQHMHIQFYFRINPIQRLEIDKAVTNRVGCRSTYNSKMIMF